MSHPEQADVHIEGSLVLREKLRRRDLKLLELREHYWYQVHPKTGRFRLRHYQKSVPWQVSSETFIEQTEYNEPNILDWVRGTYHVEASISDGLCDEGVQESNVVVHLKLSLDFTKERENCAHWTIDTRTSQIHKPAAYPGIHSGYLSAWNSSGYNTHCEVIWETPIFSPYVKIETPYRGNDKEDFKAITLGSMPKSRGGESLQQTSHVERVYLPIRGSCYVIVLQEVLKDLARLLVFGPRYADMTLAPVAEYAETFQANYMRDESSVDFFESPHFPKAALFFSRAYCQAGLGGKEEEGDGEPVPYSRCMTSVETIEALFDHYKIVREPPWIKTSKRDWVDDLGEEAMSLRTIADWRKFETKWATITSYACGLNLHEGPWAGEDWRTYIDAAV